MKRSYLSVRSCLQKMPLAPAVFGMGWNLLLALINGGFSINYRSYWYLTLAVLYFLLGTFGNAADRFSISMEAGMGFASLVLLVLLGVNLFRIAGKQKD